MSVLLTLQGVTTTCSLYHLSRRFLPSLYHQTSAAVLRVDRLSQGVKIVLCFSVHFVIRCFVRSVTCSCTRLSTPVLDVPEDLLGCLTHTPMEMGTMGQLSTGWGSSGSAGLILFTFIDNFTFLYHFHLAHCIFHHQPKLSQS